MEDTDARMRVRETRDPLLMVVAHDIRNPLSVIRLAAEQLLEPDLDEETRVRLVGVIRRSVARADELAQGLLARTG